MTFTGGNPWPFYVPANPFGPFAAFCRFLEFLVQKCFYLEENERFFRFFSSYLGSKKLRFVHTTKLGSECMWKAHNLARKLRHSTFQYNHLTLTYSIFHVNSNTFPEFCQMLYQQFSKIHSTLVVNYPSQTSFDCN